MEFTDEEDYARAYIDARQAYARLRPVYSPALDCIVGFSRMGFNHLVRKHRKFRSRAEQIRRFLLLESVSAVIEDSRVEVSYREEGIQTGGAKRVLKFWRLSLTGGDVMVIVTQIDHGNVEFLSVFQKC